VRGPARSSRTTSARSQLELDPDHLSTLDEGSAVDLGFPHETLRRLGLTN
jgi:hypothetical protein